jgi:hypothetical protein
MADSGFRLNPSLDGGDRRHEFDRSHFTPGQKDQINRMVRQADPRRSEPGRTTCTA